MTQTATGPSARALGAYYTPPAAARALARWAVRAPGDRLLEPSMGDGAFLHALRAESQARALDVELWGVELSAGAFGATISEGLVEPHRAIHADFLTVAPFAVDAVVGNPPYVRLRHLAADQARTAAAAAARVLGETMQAAGSVWMPFVLHATRFLAPGGRLALVLPYDLTYVRYARPLWRHLGTRFASLRVVRVRERMFPEILQETVLLLADGYGGRTATVEFDAYDSVRALVADAPAISEVVALGGVVTGERLFLQALLPRATRESLEARVYPRTVRAAELVTFNIGYVTGDKEFFHPDRAGVEEFGLPRTSLRPALTAGRHLRRAGLRTSGLAPESRSSLFLPPDDPALLDASERAYIARGTELGVDARYKCRVRDPWYVTPSVRTPDALLPVFAERPVLVLNDAALVASNSLLCGYLRTTTPDALASAWFTSLTLLELELHVHALGGGVMVLVPREAGRIRLPKLDDVTPERLSTVDRLLADDEVEHAFASGDSAVLRGSLGLSAADVDATRDAVETLARWRRSARVRQCAPASPSG